MLFTLLFLGCIVCGVLGLGACLFVVLVWICLILPFYYYYYFVLVGVLWLLFVCYLRVMLFLSGLYGCRLLGVCCIVCEFLICLICWLFLFYFVGLLVVFEFIYFLFRVLVVFVYLWVVVIWLCVVLFVSFMLFLVVLHVAWILRCL